MATVDPVLRTLARVVVAMSPDVSVPPDLSGIETEALDALSIAIAYDTRYDVEQHVIDELRRRGESPV
jgi:hypothetical protein